MYGSGLSYSRLRSTYDDPSSRDRERYHLPTSTSNNYGWQSSIWTDRPSSSKSDARRNSTNTTTMASSSSGQQRKPQRYARASTTSVTQLLSDSCSNLLQKLTTRVRGPSATVERNLAAAAAAATTTTTSKNIGSPTKSISGSSSTSSLLSTRNKLEDKYSYVLDRIYGRRRGDHEKTLEPSVGRNLVKSATTSNVLLSEKAYPYVSAIREKTPYKNESRHHHHYHHQYVPQYPEPPYSYLDRESAAYRVRNRTNHSELRPRRSSKPQHRSGKSEAPSLKLHAADDTTKLDVGNVDDDETTPTPTAVITAPDPISEREAKRKEIQSLIMKYSALDEVYNRGGGGGGDGVKTTTSGTTTTTTAAATIAQKYYPRLVGMSSAVSTRPKMCGRLVALLLLLPRLRPSLTNECAFRVPLTSLCKCT